jgi:predicted dehydrogenase
MAVPETSQRGNESAHDEKIAHFVQCIEQGTKPITTPSEIVNVAQIIDAVYQSAELGRSVEIMQPEL